MNFANVEKAREQYRDKIKTLSLSAIALVLLLLVVLLSLFDNRASLIIVLPTFFIFSVFSLVIISLIVMVGTRKEFANYRKLYKAYFVEQNLMSIFDDIKYSHDAELDKQLLCNTQMINVGDRYSSNDLTIGKYKDVAFRQADVHIEEEYTDSDGDTSYVTIFRGRFMIFEFPKKFNFRLEVISKHFSIGKIPSSDSETGRKFEKFEVESVDFNKMFNIYAEDGFETFYLLDPAFIASIENLGIKYDKKMIMCFINNRLYVGINEGKDAFEPPRPFKPIDEKIELEKVSKDIRIITDFVDELSLDKKIFV